MATVLVNEVIEKPCNFKASFSLCVDPCNLLLQLHVLSTHAFYSKRLQMFFKDQLDRSKATCSFEWSLLLQVSVMPMRCQMNFTFLTSRSYFFCIKQTMCLVICLHVEHGYCSLLMRASCITIG